MNSNEIRLIHNAIFCAPSDYAETPEDISIEMQDLVEFQGQGIAAEDGFVYADIKGKKYVMKFYTILKIHIRILHLDMLMFLEQLDLARKQIYIGNANIAIFIVNYWISTLLRSICVVHVKKFL